MARNPFEQLQDVVSEPRQAFEDVASLIIKAHIPSSWRVRIYEVATEVSMSAMALLEPAAS